MSQADESYVVVRNGVATSFVGPDATHYYAVTMLKCALQFWQKHRMRVNRHVGVRDMLNKASRITNKLYKPSQVEQAIADLEQTLAALRAALPVRYKVTDDA